MLPLSFENRKSPEDAAVFNEDGVLVYFGKSSRMPARAAGHAHGHPTETGWTPLDQPPAAVPMDAGTEVKDTLSRIVREEDTTYRRRVVHTVVRPHSEAELAEEAAAQVIRLRESRIRLLTGYQEVPYSAEAIRYMDEGIRSAYDEYLALFTGSVQRFTRNYSFSHQPVASRDSSWVPLFRFSPESGIHGLDAREGELVYLRYLPERMLPDSSLIQASMSATEGAAPEKVLMYRIPAATLIELRYQDEILFSTREQISQLGRVRSLPVSKVSVELDPVSGRPVRVFLDN